MRLRPDGVSVWQVDEAVGGALSLRNSSRQHATATATATAATAASPPPLVDTASPAAFHFDAVFDELSSSEAVFERLVRPVLQSSLAGINGTCFAYGQTSSGKSHTMSAMLRLAAQLVFAPCSDATRTASTVEVRVSYFEIYNEQIRDLQRQQQPQPQPNSQQSAHKQPPQSFASSGGGVGGQRLRVRQHPVYGVYIAGLTETEVADGASLLSLVQAAEARRSVASTAMNAHSSRAHTVCRFTLTTATASPSGAACERRQSVFQLIDLAGSERCHSANTSGARLREGGHINKSLLELSTVMSKLSQQQQQQHRQGRDRAAEGAGERHSGGCSAADGSSPNAVDSSAAISHIPYRNSTLTRVLEPALGGNSRTAIIACINAVSHSFNSRTSELSGSGAMAC